MATVYCTTMGQIIDIDGMFCEHCEETVKEALKSVNGVTDVAVDHETGTATIEGSADNELLIAAVSDAGYDVVGHL